MPKVKPKRGRPRKYKTPEELEKKIIYYISRKDVVPSKADLAYFLGFVSKDALTEYEKYEGFSGLIKRTYLYIEGWWTSRLSKNGCTGAIFWLKNNAGYSDVHQIGGVNGQPIQVQIIDGYVKKSDSTNVANTSP